MSEPALSDEQLLEIIGDNPPNNIVALPKPEPPKAGKPKLNFGGIKEKKAESTRTEYPELEDPAIAAQAEAFLIAQAQLEAATGAKEAARLELVKAARPFHFKTNSGRHDVPSSVSIRSSKGEVLIAFKDAYKKLDEKKHEAVKGLIGEALADRYLVQTFEFKIKSESIPEAKMQAVIDAVNKLAAELEIGDAVEVATCYKPTNEWHIARYRELTPEQNLELEDLVDKEKGFCTIAVSPARGRNK